MGDACKRIDTIMMPPTLGAITRCMTLAMMTAIKVMASTGKMVTLRAVSGATRIAVVAMRACLLLLISPVVGLLRDGIVAVILLLHRILPALLLLLLLLLLILLVVIALSHLRGSLRQTNNRRDT